MMISLPINQTLLDVEGCGATSIFNGAHRKDNQFDDLYTQPLLSSSALKQLDQHHNRDTPFVKSFAMDISPLSDSQGMAAQVPVTFPQVQVRVTIPNPRGACAATAPVHRKSNPVWANLCNMAPGTTARRKASGQCAICMPP